MLNRLVYRSKLTVERSFDLVRDIIEKSQTRNQQNELTGILVLSNGYFFQVLEGNSDPLNKTYMRINADPRHTDITLLSYGSTHSRYFQDWSMRGFDLGKQSQAARTMLETKYGLNQKRHIFPTNPDLIHGLILDLKFLSDSNDAWANQA